MYPKTSIAAPKCVLVGHFVNRYSVFCTNDLNPNFREIPEKKVYKWKKQTDKKAHCIQTEMVFVELQRFQYNIQCMRERKKADETGKFIDTTTLSHKY